jgi:TATA-binding protein-associated factor
VLIFCVKERQKRKDRLKANMDKPNPVFRSLDEWEAAKSTKMDACAKICRHDLSCNDVEDVDFKDEHFVLPPSRPSGQPFTQNKRVLIYSEFLSIRPIFQNVHAFHLTMQDT